MTDDSQTSKATGRREPTVVLVAIAFVMLMTGAFLAFSTAPNHTDTSDEQVLTGVVRRVVIDVDTGSVSISSSVRSGAMISRSIRQMFRKPETSAILENGVLMIRSRCGVPALGCNVDHEIEVPATASLDVTTSSGDVTVRNFAASARLSSTSGSIAVERLAGESLEIETISGSIKADALATERLVGRSESGSIDVSFKSIPTTLDVASTAGALDLAVPSSSYKLALSSSSAKVTVTGLEDDQNSSRSITARSQSGRVRVTGL
ncbi:MAG: hypothetical protein DCC49_05650 [Acidobacteria bacterium]|nr:MAG: hypothetical protein DCC49_05650 [Acidobacteriota bacterium]